MTKGRHKFRKFSEAETYLLQQLPMFSRVGAAALKPSLENIQALCRAIGDPQSNYKIIHVAGTNGKGTVSHLIAGILMSQGFKVGLHTSPHYKDLRERLKVNGKLPPKSFILSFLNKHKEIIDRIKPSFFEMTVAMSFAYFAKEEVDFAVVEVGLGGRLDSTNIVVPILSVITNISLDHTDLLGHTIPEIAAEKAGIIKPNVPVLIGERQEETSPVFESIALQKNALLSYAENIVSLKLEHSDLNSMSFKVTIDNNIEIFQIDISGPFQEKNISTAFAAMYLLEKQGIDINLQKVRLFFKDFRSKTKYIGRWQVIENQPLILVDSAHNIGGMHYILDQLHQMGLRQLHMVMGFVADKDREKILSSMPKNAHYYFAKANIPRGLDANVLAAEAQVIGLKGQAYSSVKEALEYAKVSASTTDLIFVGGSIFVVAEVL